MGGHLLHPKLMADVSGVACAHSLQAGDVDLDEVAGCQFLKTRSSSIIAVLCSVFHQKVHPSLIWTILTMILLVQHITIITVIKDSDRVILTINFLYNLFMDYSRPKSNPHEVHIGLPHPSVLATRYTQVLEQKQSRGWSPFARGRTNPDRLP